MWNYRICKHTEKYKKKSITKEFWKKYKGKSFTWYAVHEVFYTKKGKPELVTQDPVDFVGDKYKEVQESLAMALRDSMRMSVLNFNSIGKKRKRRR